MIFRTIGLMCLAFAIGAGQANAAQEIGEAVNAKNLVNGKLGSNTRRVRTGNDVLANEIISTGASSAALLKFLDNSNLNIGASSTVVLDKFVFNPNGSAQSVVINLSKGAMRFVSGRSEPSNFKIQTQVATLGVRGTDFVTICTAAACAVIVASGLVGVCPRPCKASYQVDSKRNFTIIERGGRYTVGSLPPSSVRRIIRAVAAGQNGLTVANLRSGNFGFIQRAETGTGGGPPINRLGQPRSISGGGGPAAVVQSDEAPAARKPKKSWHGHGHWGHKGWGRKGWGHGRRHGHNNGHGGGNINN